jgi:hypothetical protein
MAVRIKRLAFAENIQEVETERIGNTLGVCPLEEQTRDVTVGETSDGLRLFMIDLGNCVLCLFSPEKPWSVPNKLTFIRRARRASPHH